MKRQNRLPAILPIAATLVIAGCWGCNHGSIPAKSGNGSSAGSGKPSGLTGEVSIDGSSTVFKITQAVAEEFHAATPSVSVNVQYSGTSGGFKTFVTGRLDICDASRPIQQKEIDVTKENGVEYIELPVCFDALTVAVNGENDWADAMTVDELKRMWQSAAKGKVDKWSDVREGWPKEAISFSGAGKDSGTYEYFTEAICGKKGDIRSDYEPSENDNDILRSVEGNKYAIGFVPYAYYVPRQGKLKAVKIDWKPDDELGPIEPSPENVIKGIYNPLARPLFIYVHKKSAERPEVKEFVDFYLKNASSLASKVKYIPLPEDAYPKVQERFARLQIGTGFGGKSEVGLHIDEILSREPKP
ncbi:MAG TPA: PstS family phosphate ABC transporter substrate-binding protein [Pirellulaceae bacterium]|nr:PstS family phosphate ABC transporter substrate-binding protein [Pirellulaceae bacterium]